MLDWILEKLPVVIFVLVFVGQLLRGVMKTRASKPEAPPRHDELDEHRRTRDVQEEIRRKIAERRAGHMPRPAERETQIEPPAPPVVVRRDPTAIPEMPAPLKRLFGELERKVQPVPASLPAPPHVERRAAEGERQERLADEMRALEEARAVALRRAAGIATAKEKEAQSEGALRSVARGRVLDDLRDPESLRRAFVLREVLGTPVGLR